VCDAFIVKIWGRPERRADWASSAKPVISTLLLFAVQEGKLKSVDDPVRSWVQRRWPGAKRGQTPIVRTTRRAVPAIGG